LKVGLHPWGGVSPKKKTGRRGETKCPRGGRKEKEKPQGGRPLENRGPEGVQAKDRYHNKK